MKYIIDTSILIEIENGNEKVLQRIQDLKRTPFAELCITIFTFCEFYYGAMEKNQANKEKVKQRLMQYKILNTSVETGSRFCELFFALKKKGKSLPQFDTFIAAITLEHDGLLLSADSDFEHIPGLKLVFFNIMPDTNNA